MSALFRTPHRHRISLPNRSLSTFRPGLQGLFGRHAGNMQVTMWRLLFGTLALALIAPAASRADSSGNASNTSDTASVKSSHDEEEDGPDYYEGQDAPSGGAINPAAMGKASDESAD